MEDYFTLANASMDAVQAIVDDEFLMPNNLQCKFVVAILQEVRDAIIRRFPDNLTSGGLKIREYYRIVKHVESIIVKSAEEPWFVAAIVIGDCKEEFLLRISEIARLLVIIEEKVDPDRRRWLKRIDEMVKRKVSEWEKMILSARLTDEATFRVIRLPSSTQNSDFPKGSPEDHAARYLLLDNAAAHNIGVGPLEEDTKNTESGTDKFFFLGADDVKDGSLFSKNRKKGMMWMGKEFALQRPCLDWTLRARIHSTCGHPNIVRFVALVRNDIVASVNPSHLVEWMDIELLELRSRMSFMFSRHSPFDIFGAVDIMLQIALAMKYLHDRNVVHTFVRPGSIVLDVLSKTPVLLQEHVLLAKVSNFSHAEEINSDSFGLLKKEKDVHDYGKTFAALFSGEDSMFLPNVPPTLREFLTSCWDKTLTFNDLCVDLIHIKSVLMIDDSMQALDVTEGGKSAPVHSSETIEPDHEIQTEQTEALHLLLFFIILLILCIGLWLAAIICSTLPLLSFFMNVISLSICLYCLDYQQSVIWKYNTWRFLKLVLGLKRTVKMAKYVRELLPGLAPCNYVVDVGRYETNVITFMAKSSSVSVHQQKISPVPLHLCRLPGKSVRSSRTESKDAFFANFDRVRLSWSPLSFKTGLSPPRRTSKSKITSVKVSDDEPVDSGHSLIHVRFEIGSATVSVVELGLDNVHITSEVGGRKIEDFVVAMDLERLGTILAILHRWELSPGIGVVENMIYRPGAVYCHCLSLQSIAEGVCESINQFSDFYLPKSKTFYVGCIPENERGLYSNHVVTRSVIGIIVLVSMYFQLLKDYRILAIVLIVVEPVFVVGAKILETFGGLALPILWYKIFYVLCCGCQRRSKFYMRLKKWGYSMAFCDDFKPVIHNTAPISMTLPFCSLRDFSTCEGWSWSLRNWTGFDVAFDDDGRIKRIALKNSVAAERLDVAGTRKFALKVEGRQVEARSIYVAGATGVLRTQLKLDDGFTKDYTWSEDSYFLFVYLMLMWSAGRYGVIKTVETFFGIDCYHVFGTYELARHIANHELSDYHTVSMSLDHATMVL